MKKICTTLFIFLALMIMTQPVQAASFNVTTKDNGNGTLTVTVSGNVVGGFNVTAGNQSGQLAIRTLGGSDSATYNTGAGSIKVTVTAISISDAEYNVIEGESISKTVVVTEKKVEAPKPEEKPTTTPSNKPTNTTKPSTNNNTKPSNNTSKPTETKKSGDNKLASLTISQGKLSANFSPNVTTYKVDLTSQTKEIEVTAKANDSKATVSGAGKHELKIGENNIVVTVKAENGSQKTYTISIYVTESPEVYLTYKNESYGVLEDYSKMDIPKGYEVGSINTAKKEVACLTNNKTHLTLLLLQNSQNDIGWYIYMNDSIFPYQTLKYMDKEYVNVGCLEGLDGLTKANGFDEKYSRHLLNISNITIDSWKINDNYSLIYLMNEEGEDNIYQYEASEGTLQKQIVENPDDGNNEKMTGDILMGVGGIIIVFLVIGMMWMNWTGLRKKFSKNPKNRKI